jgi:hypothetical protein
LSLKAAYLIPQLAIRKSCVWLDEDEQTHAHALLLHAASENKRADQAVKCIFVARPDCATTSWDIMCERIDSYLFARSLSLLNNLMLRERPCQSLNDYVHSTLHFFDDYNETREMIDGSAAIHPHNPGLLTLCAIPAPATSVTPNNVSSKLSTPTTSSPQTK